MFEFNKKYLLDYWIIGLLTSVINAYSYTKYVSLSNQKCTTQSTLINLHPNEDT